LLRRILQADPMAIVYDAGTLRERRDRSVADRTFATLVVSVFALASLVVTALRLAGVVAHAIAKRTKDIAVCLALGAARGRVITVVVRETVVAGVVGVVSGTLASAWLSAALEGLLYAVRPADPVTLASGAVMLVTLVTVSAIVTATRAAQIDPASALKAE
jgi:ABC-type antimicrobial peptide transport system permease subunit